MFVELEMVARRAHEFDVIHAHLVAIRIAGGAGLPLKVAAKIDRTGFSNAA